MLDPLDSWRRLLSDRGKYLALYGKRGQRLLSLAARLGKATLAEWTFPELTHGKLIVSRFERPAERAIGPHIVISVADGAKRAFMVEYFYGPMRRRGADEITRISPDILAKIEAWLDTPFFDYQVVENG